jgi:hypothetical protein
MKRKVKKIITPKDYPNPIEVGLLLDGEYIKAIKLYRSRNICGLRKAKDDLDRWLNKKNLNAFSHKKRIQNLAKKWNIKLR